MTTSSLVSKFAEVAEAATRTVRQTAARFTAWYGRWNELQLEAGHQTFQQRIEPLSGRTQASKFGPYY